MLINKSLRELPQVIQLIGNGVDPLIQTIIRLLVEVVRVGELVAGLRSTRPCLVIVLKINYILI